MNLLLLQPAEMRGEAQALTMLGRGAEARVVAEQIRESAPQDVEALMLVASARFEAGEIECPRIRQMRGRHVAQ